MHSRILYTHTHTHIYAAADTRASARARAFANTKGSSPFRTLSSWKLGAARMCSSRAGVERRRKRSRMCRGREREDREIAKSTTLRSETQNGSLSPPFRIRRLAGIPTSAKVHGRAMPRPLLRGHHRGAMSLCRAVRLFARADFCFSNQFSGILESSRERSRVSEKCQ